MTKSNGAQKRPSLRAISFDQFLEKEFPPKKLILPPWMPEKSASMIYAPRGVGKTQLVLGIAIAVASGGEILGWKAPRPRKVLIIDGEMPAIDLHSRLKNAVRAPNVLRPRRRYIRLLSADIQQYGIPDLATAEGQEDIDRVIEDDDLIILDNLSTLCRSGRENEAEHWGPIQDWALRMRREGRSVLFVHHAGKGGAQRGTSRREDILDTVISLRRPEDYSPADGARFSVHFEKSRGFMGEDAEPFEARLTDDGWVRAPLNSPLTDQILELHDEKLSQREIARRVGASAATVNRIIAKAKKG